MSTTLLTSLHPAGKQRGLCRLTRPLLICVNNRFDFAWVSVLRQAVRSHLASMFAESYLHSRVKRHVWEVSSEPPPGLWTHDLPFSGSISPTTTSLCCELLMERCRDSIGTLQREGGPRPINHVQPCRGKEEWWVWTEWDVSGQMEGGISASSAQWFKSTYDFQTLFEVKLISGDFVFFLPYKQRSTRWTHAGLYFKRTHITQILREW